MTNVKRLIFWSGTNLQILNKL